MEEGEEVAKILALAVEGGACLLRLRGESRGMRPRPRRPCGGNRVGRRPRSDPTARPPSWGSGGADQDREDRAGLGVDGREDRGAREGHCEVAVLLGRGGGASPDGIPLRASAAKKERGYCHSVLSRIEKKILTWLTIC